MSPATPVEQRGRVIAKVEWLRERFERCWQLLTGSRHGPRQQFDQAVTDRQSQCRVDARACELGHSARCEPAP